jgi:colanic acid/amylovoran biosynthesis glycosyltransferase
MSTTDTLRVAHVCRVFSKTSETFLYDYFTEMDARDGVACHVAAFTRQNEAERPFRRVHLAAPGDLGVAERARLAARDKLGRAWHGESRAKAAAMERALVEIAPTVVHAHFGPNGVLVTDAAEELGAPLVVSYHGYDVSSHLADPTWLERYRTLWAQAGAVTVVSNYQRRAIVAAGCPAEKVHVVRVGKRVEELTYAAPERAARRFVCVGRFAEKKAHIDTIRAFERALEQVPDLTLEVVGAGPLFDQARAYVDTQGLAGSIELLGERPFSEVVARMRAADAFILSSKTASNGDEEGVPTVLMEAQAMGLPCVSTTHTGIPEVIPEANQWALATPGDVDGIAARIVSLCGLSVPELVELTEAGRAKIEAEFNLVTEVDRLLELYRSLV